MTKPEFTDVQEKAIGELVCDKWGCDIQTGVLEDGTPYVASRQSPDSRVLFYSISADGTVAVEDEIEPEALVRPADGSKEPGEG